MNSSKNEINVEKVCYEIPKAELHIHIEGSFEPELIMKIAKRNGVTLPYKSIEELKEKYKFKNLQEFLDIYYEACNVLIKEEDFEDLMYFYLQKTNSQGCTYAEIFFDPQSHLPRGISMEVLIKGLRSGIAKANKEFGIEANLIMCFLRHLTEEDALKTFDLALPYLDKFIAIGLDSPEVGNPPEKFINLPKRTDLDSALMEGKKGVLLLIFKEP